MVNVPVSQVCTAPAESVVLKCKIQSPWASGRMPGGTANVHPLVDVIVTPDGLASVVPVAGVLPGRLPARENVRLVLTTATLGTDPFTRMEMDGIPGQVSPK